MNALNASFILGYHGCDRTVGEELINGKEFKHSENSFDWLGSGIYFWEANPERGLEFAQEQEKRAHKQGNKYDPWVIGAAIDLGFCLDLTTKISAEHLRIVYNSFISLTKKQEYKLPVNKPGLHKLDCAVINHLHDIRAKSKQPPFDSVKGAFIEGDPIYQNSMFRGKTHLQICVRNADCIKGVFRVKGFL